MRILLQVLRVGGNPVDLMDAHAPLDAAINPLLLVLRKIVFGLCLEQKKDFFERALCLALQDNLGLVNGQRMLKIANELAG